MWHLYYLFFVFAVKSNKIKYFFKLLNHSKILVWWHEHTVNTLSISLHSFMEASSYIMCLAWFTVVRLFTSVALSVASLVQSELAVCGCEDGWGRKHKLQAGLLPLALCPTSDRPFLSTLKHNHHRLAWPQSNVDEETQHYTYDAS